MLVLLPCEEADELAEVPLSLVAAEGEADELAEVPLSLVAAEDEVELGDATEEVVVEFVPAEV